MRSRRVIVAAAIALTAISGCSQAGKPEKSDPKVATLQSAAAVPSQAAKSKAATQRPRERLDTTPEEFEAMLGPYNKCLLENGGITKEQAAKGIAKPASQAQEAKFEAANKICEPQYYPLPPWEKDPSNPEARDFARDVVKCLKRKGVKYVEVDADGISYALGGDQNDPRSISMGLDLAPGCEREVAAKMKK